MEQWYVYHREDCLLVVKHQLFCLLPCVEYLPPMNRFQRERLEDDIVQRVLNVQGSLGGRPCN